MFDRYSILKILTGDVCFVNLFRSILPVVSTECDVLIVCRQHNDRDWKFKEQHAKMWENIAGAKRYSRPHGFNIVGASSPAIPMPLVPLSIQTLFASLMLAVLCNMLQNTWHLLAYAAVM